jgi:hypothetical protein
LGIGFALVWIFIGAMIFGDLKFAVRSDRESNLVVRPRRRSAATPVSQKFSGDMGSRRRSSAA